MPLRAVTFDFHNTLADCDEWFTIEVRELVPRVLDWVAASGGSQVSQDERDAAVQHYRELRLQIMDHGNEVDAYDCAIAVLDRLGRQIDPATVRRGVDAVMRVALPESSPVPGVVSAVRELRLHGLDLAVVSSAVHHDFIEWSLAKFGILDCFSHVVSSADCGYYKSRTEIYEHTLKRLNIAASDAVHIGDSHRFDVETAGRAGMRTVWFMRSGIDASENGANLTVTSMEGLAPLILDHFGTDG
jgi:HAD superfamily hydrolase (TIGR01509 family)